MPDPLYLLLACFAFAAIALAVYLHGRRQASGLREKMEKLREALSLAQRREQALRAADAAKDDFIATLGHELRNPLNALYAAAHVLDRSELPDAASRQATVVVGRQARRMTRLIEDLLDLNRVVRGKVSLSREPLDLAGAAQEAIAGLRAAGRLERHEIELDLQEAWVRADEARVEQMIANLVGNAIKFTPEGGRIAVSVRRDGDEAVLRVRDSGIGMPVELTQRVFDLFVQGEGTQRRGAGLGIGLTLVRHLAELQGGQAFAASAGPGQGSVFTVSLPATDVRAEEAPGVAAVSSRSRHRILLVEDNDETRDAMFSALRHDGHRVYEAADGRAGLRTIAAVKPDVALVDIGLPDLDGFEVAAALRDSPERDKMVLIATTGFERPETLLRARNAGFDEYIAKPVDPDALYRLIDAAVSLRARRQAAASVSQPG